MNTLSNAAIATHLNMISELMELHGQNSFRAKSYSIAAFQIKKVDKPLAEMKPNEIYALKSVGESVGKKIVELIETNHIEVLDELIAQTPKGVLEMLQVKGIGPKKVALLWVTLGIETLSDLELAAVENRLVDVNGFGAKTQDKILESIAFMRRNAGFALFANAQLMSQDIIKWLQGAFPNDTFETVGALRRKEDALSEIEIITTVSLADLKLTCEKIAHTSLELNDDTLVLHTEAWLPVVLHKIEVHKIAEQLFFKTGDAAFLEAFQQQYSIPLTCKEEQEIFTQNQLAYIEPELRHGADILRLAKENKLPSLIEVSDIKGLIHCHSTWSDGMASLEEMAQACIAKGWEYMVISDHSKTAFYANGLNVERVLEQHKEIDELNKKLAPFKIFKSIESDILNDGELDYDDDVLSSFDMVIASVHSNLTMSEEKAMERLMAAIENKHTRILWHLTGRLLLSRKGYPVDHKKIIDACAAHHVVIEINANPRRLDMDWTFVAYAMQQGVMLSINPDAHNINGISDVQYGVASGRKAGLSKAFNLSSYSLQEMEKFVAQKRS